MQPHFTHIAVHCADIGASTRFYRDICGMRVTHERNDDGVSVVWLAEPGREAELVFVLIGGGESRPQDAQDFSHLGFALHSKAAVDALADRGRAAGCLVWEPREAPYPVGYYCALRDPDGKFVEFSFGQPLGPGADMPQLHATAPGVTDA